MCARACVWGIAPAFSLYHSAFLSCSSVQPQFFFFRTNFALWRKQEGVQMGSIIRSLKRVTESILIRCESESKGSSAVK